MTAAKLTKLAKLGPIEVPGAWGYDGSNPYYHFLYRLTKEMRADLVIELGTCDGGSASHFAAAGAGHVVTVDFHPHPLAARRLSRLPNVSVWERDTRDPLLIAQLQKVGLADILFVDTLHTPEQAGIELRRFGSRVRKGGVVLLDDIRINLGMSTFWDNLAGEKIELPWLHHSGFGAVIF